MRRKYGNLILIRLGRYIRRFYFSSPGPNLNCCLQKCFLGGPQHFINHVFQNEIFGYKDYEVSSGGM